MKAKLRRPYVTIALSDGFSTGGSQIWSKRKVVRRCGCGPVAAFDLLLYLQEKHGMGFPFPASREEYCREMQGLSLKNAVSASNLQIQIRGRAGAVSFIFALFYEKILKTLAIFYRM